MSMFPIASVTTTATTSNIIFSSIPQTFTHLQARVWGRGTFNNGGGGLSVVISFSGYTPLIRHRMWGQGSSASSQSYASSYGSVGTIPDVTADASIFGITIFDLLDYTSASKNKTLRYVGGFDRNGSGEAVFGTSLASGGAVTTLDFTTDGNWAAGSRIDIYGVSTSNATGV
jgi:hypothetical protein